MPVTVADTLGALAAAAPASAQEAARSKALQLKRCLQRHDSGTCSGRQGLGWVDGLQGVVAGSIHSMKSMSGEWTCARMRAIDIYVHTYM